MKKSLLLFVVVTVISAFSQALAQAPNEPAPPKVLYIVREEIKPGMMGTHNTHSANYANIFRTLATPNYRIAMVPVAGSENEVVYVTGIDSFKQLEDMLSATNKKLGGVSGTNKTELDRLNKEAPALHAAMRDMFALFRPDLSYNPGVDVRTMRYFSITTLRVRPGRDAQFAEYAQKLIAAARKAKVDNYHTALFQIVSGAPAGTYLLFRPMKSLSEFDDPIGMKVRAALGNDERKDLDKEAGEIYLSSETSTYLFEPNMSYVEKDFAAGDPSFWTPKPAMPPKPKKAWRNLSYRRRRRTSRLTFPHEES
jgi:hypothetical protein